LWLNLLNEYTMATAGSKVYERASAGSIVCKKTRVIGDDVIDP
jgi:hypothetical protein